MIDFFANGLCLQCNEAHNELQQLRIFHSEVEALWVKKNDEVVKTVNKVIKEHDEKFHQDIVENYSWELHENQYLYPNIHRESIIITIFNLLESKLNDLCDILSSSVNKKIKLNDLNGKGITRTYNYLTKVYDFDLSKLNPEWEYIKNVNQLRNNIVHNGAILPEDHNHKLNKFVTANPHLCGKPNANISLDSEFINEFIDGLIQFFEKLDAEVQVFIQNN